MNKEIFFTDYDVPFFVTRTPLLPLKELYSFFESIKAAGNCGLKFREQLLYKFKKPVLQEAIYLASPVLYNELTKLSHGANILEDEHSKVFSSLFKYYIRSSSRSTPFGLFASCSVGILGEQTKISLKGTRYIKRHLRLDMDYLCNLAQGIALDKTIRPHLTYYPNTSLYKVRNKLRYVEYRYNKRNLREHHLIEIDNNEIIKHILKISRNGLLFGDLITSLKEYGIPPNDAAIYLNDLIINQVIKSSLDANVTGEDYLDRIMKTLGRISFQTERAKVVYDTLFSVKNRIRSINRNNTGVSDYSDIKQILSKIDTPIEEDKLFQVDSTREASHMSLSNNRAKDILEVVHALSVIGQSANNKKTRLEYFKNAFLEKYEYSPVRLVDALDSETGLGYKNPRSLPDHFERPSPSEGGLPRFKLQKYEECMLQNKSFIEITPDDIKSNERNNVGLPNSFCVMASLYRNLVIDKKPIDFAIKVVSPSAANLLGRFCHLDKNLCDKVTEFLEMEENNQPDALFAEIAHLPQSRVGNVLARPHLRKHEIGYLALSTLPTSQQLRLDDLYLQIQGKKLVLFSKSLKKEVIPKLSSAHNYSLNNLPIYHFLCDLQYQGLKHIPNWSWENLASEAFLPRVIFKNAVLAPAQWNIKSKDVLKIFSSNSLSEAVKKIRDIYKLPSRLNLVEGDNHLLLDLDVVDCHVILKNKLKKSNMVSFLEDLPNPNNLIAERGYSSEVLIPYIRNKATETGSIAKSSFKFPTIIPSKERIFSPGSEWIYFKIYAHPRSFNKILLTVHKLVKAMLKEKIIDKWFFLRYADPKHHLRIRLHVSDRTNYNVVTIFQQKVKDLIEKETIHDVVLGTYRREWERYGKKHMEVSETFFFDNSTLVLSIINCVNKVKYSNEIIAMYIIDNILSSFNFNIRAKILFCNSTSDGFSNEFRLPNDKGKREFLKTYFRKNRESLESIFKIPVSKLKPSEIGIDLKPHIRRIKVIADEIRKSQLNNDQPSIESLLGSYIHLFINRLMTNQQRWSECIIYYTLVKYYASCEARAKYNHSIN